MCAYVDAKKAAIIFKISVRITLQGVVEARGVDENNTSIESGLTRELDLGRTQFQVRPDP